MSIALLETHVRLESRSQVTQTDWEPFTCTHMTGEAAGVETGQRESFRAELEDGPSLEQDKEPEETNEESYISWGRTQAVLGHRQFGRRGCHGGM